MQSYGELRRATGATESYGELRGVTYQIPTISNLSEPGSCLPEPRSCYGELQGATGSYGELRGATGSYGKLRGAIPAIFNLSEPGSCLPGSSGELRRATESYWTFLSLDPAPVK